VKLDSRHSSSWRSRLQGHLYCASRNDKQVWLFGCSAFKLLIEAGYFIYLLWM